VTPRVRPRVRGFRQRQSAETRFVPWRGVTSRRNARVCLADFWVQRRGILQHRHARNATFAWGWKKGAAGGGHGHYWSRPTNGPRSNVAPISADNHHICFCFRRPDRRSASATRWFRFPFLHHPSCLVFALDWACLFL
jgi:hypothetical protein